MARHESDRHDLFAELAALSPRLELRLAPGEATVCAGRRESTRGWSLFFGPDHVYHFNAAGGLRRAYVVGFLYRSEGTTLARLQRERTATDTVLLRHDLAAEELAVFADSMRARIGELSTAISNHDVEVLRSEPEDHNQLPELLNGLHVIIGAHPALSPAIRKGKA